MQNQVFILGTSSCAPQMVKNPLKGSQACFSSQAALKALVMSAPLGDFTFDAVQSMLRGAKGTSCSCEWATFARTRYEYPLENMADPYSPPRSWREARAARRSVSCCESGATINLLFCRSITRESNASFGQPR